MKKNLQIPLLVSQIKAGKRTAFKELYATYSRLFKGIAYRYTHNYDYSNDVVQEAFIKIFKNIHSYTGEGNFEGWMKRILVNCCLDYIQKEQRFSFESEQMVMEVPTQDLGDALSSLTVQEIVDVVNQLPEGYKVVFNLSVFEGYSHKEIGDTLGISASASRSQLTKAKAKLREELKHINILSAIA